MECFRSSKKKVPKGGTERGQNCSYKKKRRGLEIKERKRPCV